MQPAASSGVHGQEQGACDLPYPEPYSATDLFTVIPVAGLLLVWGCSGWPKELGGPLFPPKGKWSQTLDDQLKAGEDEPCCQSCISTHLCCFCLEKKMLVYADSHLTSFRGVISEHDLGTAVFQL